MEHTGEATVIHHCAVLGRLETQVRYFKICEDDGAAPSALSVSIYFRFRAPRKRPGAYFMAFRDNQRYITIEVGGQTVWDSRSVVPCDMEKWEAENQWHRQAERNRHKTRRP